MLDTGYLTNLIVSVLNVHAPWIVFQQRKHFQPWITAETSKLMKKRDKLKQEAKTMALIDGVAVSAAQTSLWHEYRKIRNKVNNRTKFEEISYKKEKVKTCQQSSSMTWNLAKKFMNWESGGPPTQLEVQGQFGIHLISKAQDIAHVMNQYFVEKVQTIKNSLNNVPLDLSCCIQIMRGRYLSLSLIYVSVKKVRQLLSSLKSKTSTSVDELDSLSVKLAADYIAGPLHHVISLSIMQQKFPSG